MKLGQGGLGGRLDADWTSHKDRGTGVTLESVEKGRTNANSSLWEMMGRGADGH